jgi:Na+-driven multidrug efflux pump
MSWGPHFFQIFQNNNENVESQTRRFYVLQSLGLALTGLVCVIALPYAANIIGGNLIYYANFKIELAFLFIGYIFCIPFWHSQNYYFATNKGDDLMYLSLWAGGIGFIAWIACMHFFGALGIYIGFPLQAAIKSGAGWIAAKKIWEIRPPIVIIVVSASIILLGAYIPN